MKRGLIFILLAMLSAGSSSAVNYYVSQSSGDDLWSGLSPDWNGTDGPKQTLSAAEAIIRTSPPGTRVLLRRGDTWTEPSGSNGISLSGVQGTPTLPVTFGAYGDGEKPILDINTTTATIYLRGSDYPRQTSYIIIEDLHITTSLSPGSRPGIGLTFIETINSDGPHHVTVRNCIVENLKSGIYAQGLSHDITVENSVIRNNYALPPETGHTQGMFISIQNFTLKNNIFECNGKNIKCGAAENSWFDHNIYLSHCENCLLENNTFRNALDAIKLRKGNNVVIRGNTIYNMDLMGITAGADAEQFLNNTIIENNEIYDTSLGIVIKDQSSGAGHVNNMIVRNNIFREPKIGQTYGVGGTYSSIDSSYSNGVYIYSNLFFGLNSRIGLSINANSKKDVAVKNNIFIGRDSSKALLNLPADISNVDIDNNLYYDSQGGDIISWNGNSYSSISSFATASGKENNGLQGNPGLGSDYSLTETSIAIDAGDGLAGYVDYDMEGIRRPQGSAWDLGPYELFWDGQCSAADSNGDNTVEIAELSIVISGWKAGNFSITALIGAIDEWKNGC